MKLSNTIANKYWNEVKSKFPTIKKEEEKYLQNLKPILEDYFEEHADSTLEDLHNAFGEPVYVVTQFYFSSPSLFLSRFFYFTYVKITLVVALIIMMLVVGFYLFTAIQTNQVFADEEIVTEEEFIH